MGITSKINSIANKLFNRNVTFYFDIPASEQNAYLMHFPEPKDDIDRSYYQYKCQMFFYKWYVVLGLNLAALPLLLLYLLKGNDGTDDKQHAQKAVFFNDGKPFNIVPEEYEHQQDIEVISEKKENLNKQDRIFFSKVFARHPFSWYFLLKNLIKVRFYSYEINTKAIDDIVVCDEYSFTSSVLTAYCNYYGKRHINVMHGEKLYFIRDSFFRFDKCYVWDEHYVKLFEKLRADSKQFYIALPDSFRFKDDSVRKSVDFTYYLASEHDEKLGTIIKSLSLLASNGYRVAVRPHPRYSDIQEIRALVKDGLLIEDTGGLTIEESLLRTRHAVSLYSTVLNQALNNGIIIVIDDIADPGLYNKLQSLDYIMLSKEHLLLSDILSA